MLTITLALFTLVQGQPLSGGWHAHYTQMRFGPGPPNYTIMFAWRERNGGEVAIDIYEVDIKPKLMKSYILKRQWEILNAVTHQYHPPSYENIDGVYVKTFPTWLITTDIIERGQRRTIVWDFGADYKPLVLLDARNADVSRLSEGIVVERALAKQLPIEQRGTRFKLEQRVERIHLFSFPMSYPGGAFRSSLWYTIIGR